LRASREDGLHNLAVEHSAFLRDDADVMDRRLLALTKEEAAHRTVGAERD
jgi:hypothetical protein